MSTRAPAKSRRAPARRRGRERRRSHPVAEAIGAVFVRKREGDAKVARRVTVAAVLAICTASFPLVTQIVALARILVWGCP